MFARRATIIGVGVALTLAACGSSDPSTEPADEPTPAATAAAPATEATTETAETPPPPVEGEAPAEIDTPAATEATTETAVPATEAPVVTDAPEAAPEPAPVGGRAFAADVQPDALFDGNPFPDLVVDDVGRDGRANIANILPSDRPVLLWTWAPH